MEGFGGAFGDGAGHGPADESSVSERDELLKLRREQPIQAIVAGHAILFCDGTTTFLPVEADWLFAGPDLREPGA